MQAIAQSMSLMAYESPEYTILLCAAEHGRNAAQFFGYLSGGCDSNTLTKVQAGQGLLLSCIQARGISIATPPGGPGTEGRAAAGSHRPG